MAGRRKERGERERQSRREVARHARLHAIAVAAIVLAGRPRIDEPLSRAWSVRCGTTRLTTKIWLLLPSCFYLKIIRDGTPGEAKQRRRHQVRSSTEAGCCVPRPVP